MQLIQRLGPPFLILLWSLSYFFEIHDQGTQDQMLIRPVFYIMVILFIVNAITDFIELKKNNTDSFSISDGTQKILCYVVAVACYILILPYMGFIVASIIFLLGSLYLLGVRKKSMLLGLPIVMSMFLYIMFVELLQVPLP